MKEPGKKRIERNCRKLKFPIFCEDEANLQEYMELAKVYGLECHK